MGPLWKWVSLAAAGTARAANSPMEDAMRIPRLALLALPCAILAYASAADAQQQRRSSQQQQQQRTDPQSSMVDQLNQQSLDRARQGMNSPTPGPDTTSNLNRMSEDAARQGRSMNQAPMPFR